MKDYRLINFILVLLVLGLIVASGSPKKGPDNSAYFLDSNSSDKDKK